MKEPLKKNLKQLFREKIGPTFREWIKAAFDAKIHQANEVYEMDINGITFEAKITFKEKQ